MFKGVMKTWVLALLVWPLIVSAEPAYKGQGSDGVIRPNVEPTTLGQSDNEMIWAVIMWKSEGFRTPEISRDNIFCWDQFLSSVPDRQAKECDLVVYTGDNNRIAYGLVLEVPKPGEAITVVYPTPADSSVIVIEGVPPAKVLGFLRPRKLGSMSI